MVKTNIIEDEVLEVKEQLRIYFPDIQEQKLNQKDFLYQEFKRLDSEFNVRYDSSYQSLVNFSQTKDLPIHRWFYYQEGYSPELIRKILKYIDLKNISHLFDPFVGGGTSLVVAQELGIKSTGIETNPFSSFLAKTKTQKYTTQEINDALNFSLPEFQKKHSTYDKYELSIIKKLFDVENFDKIELLKKNILIIESNKVKNILFTALLCILQDVSYYKKAGNGLKRKRIYNKLDVYDAFINKLNNICEDLKLQSSSTESTIINDSCLNIDNYPINEIDVSIFSPPYANCFDYYEVYKIELWVGEFVKTYKQLRTLRKEALTSNLNANLQKELGKVTSSKILLPIIYNLSQENLWDKKIPKMLSLYFSEMQLLLRNIYSRTKKGGYCIIVVGNSSYGGFAIPTDLILAEIGREIGFKVKEIIVARRNETSSQQYKKIGNLIEYIRESIIVFKKNV